MYSRVKFCVVAGGLGAVVEKVKDALPSLEDVVDENILEYCSLDKLVRLKGFSHVIHLHFKLQPDT